MSNNLIRRLLAVYQTPPGDNPQAYLEEVAQLTASYPEAVLDSAGNEIMRTYQPNHREPWPSPKRIVDACSAALETAAAMKTRASSDKTSGRDNYAMAYQQLRDPRNRDLVHKAADQGYLLGVFTFVLKHRRMPTWDECEPLVRVSEFRAACGDGRQNLAWGRPQLMQLALAIEARQQRLVRDIMHGGR